MVNTECMGTLSFSAQYEAPKAAGLATMASAVNGCPAAAAELTALSSSSGPGSGSVQAPQTLKMICRTCQGEGGDGWQRYSGRRCLTQKLPDSQQPPAGQCPPARQPQLRCHTPLGASAADPPSQSLPIRSTFNVPPYLFSLLHDARQVEAREDAPAGGGDACDATVE